MLQLSLIPYQSCAVLLEDFISVLKAIFASTCQRAIARSRGCRPYTWSQRAMYVRNEAVFKPGFQLTWAGHKSSWVSGGWGEGEMYVGRLTGHFSTGQETNTSSFFLSRIFSLPWLKWTVCVDYITREKACQAKRACSDCKTAKETKMCEASYECTLVSKYLGLQFI